MDGTMPIALVVVMGLVTVFIGLICLIIITKLMSLIINAFGKKETASPAPAAAVIAPAPAPIPSVPAVNKQQVMAAIGAAIAEDMGTDVSHIKIHSIRRT